MRPLHRSTFVPLSLVLAAALHARAGEVMTPARVAETRSVTSAAMSPDGKQVAYVVSVPRKPLAEDDGLPWTELYVLDVASGATRPFVTGKQNVANVQWTPDSKGVAFLAKRGDDKNNCLYVLATDGGEARKAAALDEAISDYSFASDGARVALVANEPKPEAMKKREGKGFKQEIYEEDWQPAKIWIAKAFDLGAKPTELAFDGSAHHVEWSPVDDRLAISVTPTPLTDDEYMRIRVHVIDANDGHLLAHCDNPGKLGDFAWSPDGKWIAMVAGLDVHDPAPECLMVSPASGGAPVDVLPNYPGKIDALGWRDAASILYVASQGCATVFERVEAKPGSTPKTIVKGGEAILTTISLASDGQSAAFVASSPSHAPELYTMKHGDTAPTRRTDSNPWLKDVRLAKQEVVKFKARDGLELEGVLLHPLGETKGTRYPLIVYVHGGPEAHEKNGWITGYATPGQVSAARGFAVFHVNYRGSTGRGLAFSKSSQGDPAGKEFDDVVDAVDALIASGLVDKSKVAVTGGSYGGYATAWLSTKYSDRFAAGVMFVGISDKLSKVGTTDIADEDYYVHLMKRPWEEWNTLLERSPIFYAGQCKTPLLILHGKDDPRVNPGQSREMYRHLKLRSAAPVRLVFYPGEGHGNRRSATRYDYNLRMLQWIEHYLTGPGGAMPPFELDYEGKPDAAGATTPATASTR
jgi:dipeptidyl aminopeptidase/acylaminoacyl peptidase